MMTMMQEMMRNPDTMKEMEQMLKKFQLHFESHSADDLTVLEVPKLLAEYKRLAGFFSAVQQQTGSSKIV